MERWELLGLVFGVAIAAALIVAFVLIALR